MPVVTYLMPLVYQIIQQSGNAGIWTKDVQLKFVEVLQTEPEAKTEA